MRPGQSATALPGLLSLPLPCVACMQGSMLQVAWRPRRARRPPGRRETTVPLRATGIYSRSCRSSYCRSLPATLFPLRLFPPPGSGLGRFPRVDPYRCLALPAAQAGASEPSLLFFHADADKVVSSFSAEDIWVGDAGRSRRSIPSICCHARTHGPSILAASLPFFRCVRLG
jgi:hypothetical protein